MKRTIFSLFLFFFIFYLTYILSLIFERNLLNLIICFVFVFFILEIIFLILRRLFKYNKFFAIKNNLLYTFHPYLPYILAPGQFSEEKRPTNYILQKKTYYFPKLKTNNLGFTNGINGSRSVSKRGKNKFTIGCIGNSTTHNYILDGKKILSYPIILEQFLKKKFKKKNIEVNNFGVGLYNSTEILIRFIIQILDLKPNLIVIYIGHNDYEAYLANNFKGDYSHYRQNLFKYYWRINLYNFISNFKLKLLNLIFQNLLNININSSLDHFITKKNINFKNNFKNKTFAFERNIQTIISLCKSQKIDLMLSTYCYFLHPKIKNKLNYIKIKKIVEYENKIIKKLAKKNNIKLIDNAKLIKKNDLNFLDSQHFTPEGMKKIARNFFKRINIYDR